MAVMPPQDYVNLPLGGYYLEAVDPGFTNPTYYKDARGIARTIPITFHGGLRGTREGFASNLTFPITTPRLYAMRGTEPEIRRTRIYAATSNNDGLMSRLKFGGAVPSATTRSG